MSKQVLKQVSPLTSVWIDKEDKKQSSIDWLLSSSKQLYYDLHEGKIHQREYHPKLKEIEAKARQMHKEEVELFGALCCSKIVHKNLWSLDKLYNETFGGQDNE